MLSLDFQLSIGNRDVNCLCDNILIEVSIMTIREQIVYKVKKLPENFLPEVYEFVDRLGERKTEKETEPLSLMQRLRKIKIEGPRDFSRNIDLYMNGEKNIDENID